MCAAAGRAARPARVFGEADPRARPAPPEITKAKAPAPAKARAGFAAPLGSHPPVDKEHHRASPACCKPVAAELTPEPCLRISFP